jgi:mono/diheme cytochrome c family protein
LASLHCDLVRRFLVLGLVLLLPLFVAACGGSDKKNTAPDTVIGPVPTGGTGSEAPAGDPAAGKTVFTESCGSCHALADAGTTGTTGPNLDDIQPDEATVSSQVTNGGGGMPAFGGTLSEQQIADVSAYVAQAAGS